MSQSTFSSMRAKGESSHKAKVAAHRSAGGKIGAAAAVHKHEAHMHPGKTRTKLRSGGAAEGESSKPRLDRAGGGKAKKSGGGKGKHGQQVNIVVAGGGHGQPPAGGGAPPPGAMMAPKPPMPMLPPGAGGPPGAGAPPPMPPRPPISGPPVGAGVPGMRASGGRAAHARGGKTYTAGAESGEGRLQKMENYGKKAPAGENHGEVEKTENEGVSGNTENKAA